MEGNKRSKGGCNPFGGVTVVYESWLNEVLTLCASRPREGAN